MANGESWPRPMPGFVEYAESLAEAKNEGCPINFAILSAGHASFIRKCLETSGLAQPDIMITDETIRGMNSTLAPEQLTKPSLMPLQQAVLQWTAIIGSKKTVDIHGSGMAERIKIIGDSEEKDGGLARNAGVPFIHVTPETSFEAWTTLKSMHWLAQREIK